MLGLGLALSIAKKTLGDAIDGLLSTLRGRATYYENGSASKSTIKAIDNADILDKASILLTPTAYSDARVHSVKTYTGDELVTNGTFDTDSNWSATNGATITGGVLNIDYNLGNGSTTQSNVFTIGKTYKIQLNVDDSSTGTARINSGVLATILSNGLNTFYIEATGTTLEIRNHVNFVGSIDNVSVVDVSSDFDFDRASSATRINSSANIEDITSDLARINYDSNGENGHILLEPTSTNLITYSEDFSEWTLGNNSTLTYESDVVAPDGSLGVYRLQNPATFSTFIQSPSFSNSNPLTVSLYVKSTGSGNDNFNFFTGGTNVSDLKTATSEWQRFDYTADGSSMYIVNDGDTYASDIYIWGAQAEALSYPTSYIPTLTGSTVTRATETLTGSGNSTLINSTEGVLYAEIKVPQSYGSNLNISISDSTSSEYVKFIILTTNNVRAEIQGSSNAQQRQTSFTYDTYTKLAISYNSTECKFFINGSQIGTTITTHTLPSGLNTLEFARGDGQANFYGKCKALAVFDEALSDTELQNLTS